MTEVSIDEAEKTLSALLAAAAGGEEVVIRDAHFAAKLSPVQPQTEEPQRLPRFGSGKGLVIYMADDFDAPLEDFKEYME